MYIVFLVLFRFIAVQVLSCAPHPNFCSDPSPLLLEGAIAHMSEADRHQKSLPMPNSCAHHLSILFCCLCLYNTYAIPFCFVYLRGRSRKM